MISSPITYQEVKVHSEQFYAMQRFAEEFDHNISTERENYRLIAHINNGVLFGYTDYITVELAFPSFHPIYTKPHHVLKVLNDWRAHCEISKSNGLIGVPVETNALRKNFPLKTMEKLNLLKVNRELFATKTFQS